MIQSATLFTPAVNDGHLKKPSAAEESAKEPSPIDANKPANNLAPFGVFENSPRVLQPTSASNHSRARNPYSAFANRIQRLRNPGTKGTGNKGDSATTRSASGTPEPQAPHRDQTPESTPQKALDAQVTASVSSPKNANETAHGPDTSSISEFDGNPVVENPKTSQISVFSPSRPKSPLLENAPSPIEDASVQQDQDPKTDVDKSSVIEISDESQVASVTPQKRKHEETEEPETRPSSPAHMSGSSIGRFASLPEAQVPVSIPEPEEDDFDIDANSSQLPDTQFTQTETQDLSYEGDESKCFSGNERTVKRRKYYDAMDTVLMKALQDKKRASLKIGHMERLAKKKEAELKELQAKVEALEKESQEASQQLVTKNQECDALKKKIEEVNSQKDAAKGLFSKFASEIHRAFGN